MYIFHVVKYVSLCSMHVYTYKLNIHKIMVQKQICLFVYNYV